MSEHVSGSNIAEAWVNAFDRLASAKHHEYVNFTVTIENPGLELSGVRRRLDRAVADLKAGGARFDKSVHTVANTIFPVSLYRAGRPDAFYAAVRGSQGRRAPSPTSWGSKGGTYAGRLVRYPTHGKGELNQIKRMIEFLDAEKVYRDRYEISLVSESPDDALKAPTACTSASTFVPAYDNAVRGGQCLSHISLNVTAGKLSMAALYRHQTFVERAYGNFLGLARLQHFLVQESRRDLEVGELMVIASHAEIESSAASQRDALLQSCKELLTEQSVPIEWQARPFGSSWTDLELPSPTEQI